MTGTPAEPRITPAYGRISALGVALLVLMTAFPWFVPQWNARLQAAWFDTCQRLHPRRIESLPVTVVAIDEASLRRFGQWPWPRTVLAALVAAIQHNDPAAIGLDILMPEPDRLSPERALAGEWQKDPLLTSRIAALPSNDHELARALASAHAVLPLAGIPERTDREPLAPPFVVIDRSRRGDSVATRVPSYPGALTNIEELDAAAAGHGVISAGAADQVIRRTPLVVRIGDRFAPSLSLELLRVALGAPDVRLVADGASVDTVAVGAMVIPTEPDGAIRIYYSPRDGRRLVSAVDVLDGKADTLILQRKLVLIGASALAIGDYQNTPLGVSMPGSEIHAQLLENLFDQSALARPRYAPVVESIAFVTLGLLVIAVTPRWKPFHAGSIALASIALPLVAGVGAFVLARLVFDAASVSLGLVILFGVLITMTLSDARRVRSALQRIVHKQREEAAYIAGELGAAQRIQVGYLPRADALRDDPRIEVAAAMIPARDVGGDLYDFFRLDADRVFFLIGDVSGKGLSASMFMAVSKALYKSATLRNPTADVGELMRSANEEVSRDNAQMLFVAACAAVLDLRSGALTYCNAGHENPYVLSSDQPDATRLVDGAGPPLCTVDRFPYRGATHVLCAGEVVCLVTDGVAEAQDRHGARFGGVGLDAAIDRWRTTEATARSLVDRICEDVRGFSAGTEPADDVTVLAVRWRGPAATA